MKDKRLEVKLSVRGDGSLTRNSGARSSNRSNRSNSSNNSGLPVSEIFATDRYSTPYHRSFDILSKHRRHPNQYGYPAQSLQVLNQYEQQPRYVPSRNNPYIDYDEHPRLYYPRQQFHPIEEQLYRPVYKDPSIRLHGTLPRSANHHNQQRDDPYERNLYTLPARRVRISDFPTIHGYGKYLIAMYFIFKLFRQVFFFVFFSSATIIFRVHGHL